MAGNFWRHTSRLFDGPAFDGSMSPEHGRQRRVPAQRDSRCAALPASAAEYQPTMTAHRAPTWILPDHGGAVSDCTEQHRCVGGNRRVGTKECLNTGLQVRANDHRSRRTRGIVTYSRHPHATTRCFGGYQRATHTQPTDSHIHLALETSTHTKPAANQPHAWSWHPCMGLPRTGRPAQRTPPQHAWHNAHGAGSTLALHLQRKSSRTA